MDCRSAGGRAMRLGIFLAIVVVGVSMMSADASEPSDSMVVTDATGWPIPETRVDPFVPGQVIARFDSGVVEWIS